MGPRKFEALLPMSESETVREEEKIRQQSRITESSKWRPRWRLTLRGVHGCFKLRCSRGGKERTDANTTLALGLLGRKIRVVPQSDAMYFKQSVIHIHPSIHRKDQTNNVNNSAHNNTIGAIFGQ